jgi:metal-dependent HD superfamily phosphatase/phosphodiesterase
LAESHLAVLTLEDVRANPLVSTYIRMANQHMQAQGYTEHGERHAVYTAHLARKILAELGYSTRQQELAAIAGYLHDIGNVVSRVNHGQNGALLAHTILLAMGMPAEELCVVMQAIGDHEEEHFDFPSGPVFSAVVIADKSDVHRTRVRNPDPSKFDIHDRVNYAAQERNLRIDREKKEIALDLKVDTSIGSVREYFEVFLSRMMMCRKAANCLGCNFQLEINNLKLL